MLIRKLFKAEMAHMVPGAYTQRCHYLHGHSYKHELFLEGNRPNSVSMVADFKGIKDMGLNDLYDSFDHAVMIWEKDPLASMASKINPNRHIIVPFIPTAEMISKACFIICQAILETSAPLSGENGVRVVKTIVHETETGYGSYRESDLESDQFPDIQFHRWIFSEGIKKDRKSPHWHKKVLNHLGTKEELIASS